MLYPYEHVPPLCDDNRLEDWQLKGHHAPCNIHSLATGATYKCLLPEPWITSHAGASTRTLNGGNNNLELFGIVRCR